MKTPKTEIFPLSVCAAILLFAPLSLGVVHPWSVAIWKLLVSALFLFAMLGAMRDGPPEFKSNGFNITVILLIVFTMIQLIPLPVSLMKLLAPRRFELMYGGFAAFAAGGVPLFHPLSVNPHATAKMLSTVIFYAALFFGILLTMKNRKGVKFLSYSLMLSGFTVAFIAIAQKFSHARGIYWSGETAWAFYGTFVNPNHCAVFLSAAAIFTFSGFIREKTGTAKILLGFIFSIMTLALFYSLSRGAAVSFLIPMTVFCTLLFLGPKGDNKMSRTNRISVIAVTLVVIIFLAWWGTYRFFGELSSLGDIQTAGAYRLTLWKNSLTMFSKFLLFGSGLGTFQTAIAPFRTFSGNTYVEVAENDYIQLLSETGLIGMILVAGALFFILMRAKRLLSRGLEEVPRAQLGAIFGLSAIALNSLVSFNFYVPGIMTVVIFFTALIFSGATKRS